MVRQDLGLRGTYLIVNSEDGLFDALFVRQRKNEGTLAVPEQMADLAQTERSRSRRGAVQRRGCNELLHPFGRKSHKGRRWEPEGGERRPRCNSRPGQEHAVQGTAAFKVVAVIRVV